MTSSVPHLEFGCILSSFHACKHMICNVSLNQQTYTHKMGSTSIQVSWYDAQTSISTCNQITSTYKHKAPFLSAKIFVQWQIDTSMRKIQGFPHPEKGLYYSQRKENDSDHAASSLYIGESRACSTGYSTTFLSFPTLWRCSTFTCPQACSGPCRGRRSPRMRHR